jgi:2-oxoglutarate ferredoxin oxidoreductase subunit beta
MSSQDFVREEALPIDWCQGCGLHILYSGITEVFDELGLDKSVVVSGIGCTGRNAGYFNLGTIHGLHGRAIPLAVGVKTSNSNLNVLVFSGDGDILGIGGNHLVHAARRNDNITVLCNVNEVFAMTGRQTAPTTQLGEKTVTSPDGNLYEPLNTQGIITSNKNYFYARTTPMFKDHFKKVLKEAIEHKGFSFIETRFNCVIDHAKKTGMNIAEMYKENKEGFSIVEEDRELKDNELGIRKK